MKKSHSLLTFVALSALLASCANNPPAIGTGDTLSDTPPTNSENTMAREDYVGKTVEQAQTFALANGVSFRVVRNNGEFLPATMDYQIGRINAAVENGIIVSYDVEGQGATEIIDYVALTVDQAKEMAAKMNVPFRVVMEDGVDLPTTRDFRLGRINATVVEGKVVSYEVEGQNTVPTDVK